MTTVVAERLRDGLKRKADDMRALAQEHGQQNDHYDLIELSLRLVAEVCNDVAEEGDE
jgi:hypothetical protein